MVTGILADFNIEGQLDILVGILENGSWRDLWLEMHLPIRLLADVRMAPETPDAQIWRLCQREALVLVTANRNEEQPDSLEATIRNENTSNCLPVITLTDPRRIPRDKQYAQHTADRLIEYLFDIEKLRGAGRLYVP